MLTAVSANTRIHLAESLPIIKDGRPDLNSRLTEYLIGEVEDGSATAEAVADLVDCLVDEAQSVVDSGHFVRSGLAQRRAILLEKAGISLSEVGDTIVPLIKDLVGGERAQPVASAWSDAFWALFGKKQ